MYLTIQRFFLLLFWVCCNAGLYAQKPVIDTSAFDSWLTADNGVISNNGHYVLYTIQVNFNKPMTLMIHAIKSSWKKEIFNARSAAFTEDSRKVIFIKGKDSLALLTTGTSQIEYIPYVSSFKLFKIKQAEYLEYKINKPEKQLVLFNLQSGKQLFFSGVGEHQTSSNGQTLVYTTSTTKGNTTDNVLNWVKLPDGKNQTIKEDFNIANLTLDNTGEQLAFTVEDTTGEHVERTFWYYKAGMAKPLLLADKHSSGIDSNLQLGEISQFSNDGSKLFFTLLEKKCQQVKSDVVMVDIWSYTDSKIQSQQLEEQLGPRSYVAVFNLDKHHIIRLEQEDETLAWKTDNVACIIYRQGDGDEEHWSAASQRSLYLINTNDGQKKGFNVDIRFPELSPNHRYVTGLEYVWSNLYSYDLTNGNSYNLTGGLPIPPGNTLNREYTDAQPYFNKYCGLQFAAWLTNNKRLLLYDDFDIWMVDSEGKKAPVNLTNGYGRKNNIVFRLSNRGDKKKIIENNEKTIITAFNRINKHNGFYQINLNKKSDPQLLTMGPYIYELPDYGYGGFAPMKARDADIYLVKHSCASQAPNYFWTKDFKSYTPISNVYPEKEYNWLTSELLTFTTLSGKTEQGVLYKPENFDTSQQYPLIIHYYEQKSSELNRYHAPASHNGDLDISWFVSHGYLVFTPDIHYTIGEPGQSAYNSIVGAASYLSNFPWVDARKMGIQGHSFGGYETNYLVTHTDLFAAAVASSGPSDLVSEYNGWPGKSINKQFFSEVWQLRIGATLWERQDLYIKNSPIFFADKVTTPLLIIANKADRNVPFDQGVEFFTALRRLGKKVWMFQYDDGGHGLRGKEYTDYIIRMTQFFDHYLKSAPAPGWMTRGIPAKSKGTTMGYEIDTEIKTPPEGGLLNAEEKQKLEALKHRKPITITFE